MGWPYHFVDLSPDESSKRRLVLNKYGSIAQLSALALIVAVVAWRWLVPSIKPKLANPQPLTAITDDVELRLRSEGDDEEIVAGEETVGLMTEDVEDEGRQDPSISGPRTGVKAQTSLVPQRSRFNRWLDGGIMKGWKETRRQILAVGLWGAWLSVLVFRETGDDYLHLTKRFAQVAASLLPFHYVLGTSSRLSPLPKLFKVSASAQYNAYHRLNGALLLILLACHISLYLNFYIQKGLFLKRVQDLDVQMGLSMAATLVVLTVFAREVIRKSWRPAFIVTHVVGAGLLLTLLFFHATVARWYAIEAGVVYLGVIYEKIMRQMKHRG